jgi:ketosteroid isomerase-like protein
MKLINSIALLIALSCVGLARAQEESPSVAAEEKPPSAVDAQTPVSSAPPAKAEQGTAREKEATTGAKKEQPSPSPSAAPTIRKLNVRAILKDNENRWEAAIASHDTASVEALVADDFIGVNSKGKVSNRRALLHEMKSSKDTYSSARNENLDVHIYGGSVAVVVGTVREKGTSQDGKAFDKTERFTDTWMERNGKWQCIASQVMLVSPK